MLLQQDDLVMCEIEVEFGGDIPKDPPEDKIDSILKAEKKSLGYSTISKSVGKCRNFMLFTGCVEFSLI